MNGWNVLIVDDDLELGAMLVELFGNEGFSASHVASGAGALARIAQESVGVAIIDVMMPEMDGLELLRRLRRERQLPILMLTAKGDDNDRILGLELGADDYLPKPFNPRELVARVRAIVRRSAGQSEEWRPPVMLGPLFMDPHSLSASIQGVPIRLTVAEFLVLETLARSSGCMQTRSTLSCQALGRPLTPFDRSIDTHVANIRRKLSCDGGQISIRSFRGQGYVLTLASAVD